MIPLRDNSADHRLTPLNTLLIAANIAVFVREVTLGSAASAFVARYAMVPARVTNSRLSDLFMITARGPLWPPLTLATSLFVHGGLAHIAGNMLYLFIFGPAVEERTGPSRYLIFYFLAGFASDAATILMAPASPVPVIGASGAIAGVLGAYFVFYPRGRILSFLPPLFVSIPAVLFLIVWFSVQLYSGITSGASDTLFGGIAWWAHVGGFLFGVMTGPMLARASVSPPRRRSPRR